MTNDLHPLRPRPHQPQVIHRRTRRDNADDLTFVQHGDAIRVGLLELAWFDDQFDSVEDLAHTLGRKRSHVFAELCFVHRENLRHVDHAVLGQVAFPVVQQNISGCLGAFQIGGQRADDHRPNLTAIENIVLNEEMRTFVAGLRPRRRFKVNPVDVALMITIHPPPCGDVNGLSGGAGFARRGRAHPHKRN